MREITALLTTLIATPFVYAAMVNVKPSTLPEAYSEVADGYIIIT